MGRPSAQGEPHPAGGGGLGAPLAVVTLANPVAAALIGLTLLGQCLKGGVAGVLLALAGSRMEKLELEVAARPARSFALGLVSVVVIFAVAVALTL